MKSFTLCRGGIRQVPEGYLKGVRKHLPLRVSRVYLGVINIAKHHPRRVMQVEFRAA